MMYQLITTKCRRTVTGTLAQAIRSAKRMDAELQHAYGVNVWTCEGDTINPGGVILKKVATVYDDKVELGGMLDVLRDEAVAAGDLAQVAICERAIAGEAEAVLECVRVISYAQAQAD